jgi:alpha-D-xyloside xylohydrolase
VSDTTLSRRKALQLALAGAVTPLPGLTWSAAASTAPSRVPEWTLTTSQGTLRIGALSDRALRVRFVPPQAATDVPPRSLTLLPDRSTALMQQVPGAGTTRLELPAIRCEIDDATGTLRFLDRNGSLLLAEATGTRRLAASRLGDELTFIAEQAFESPAGERLYGTGCFQDGALDLRGLPRRLTQVNTQISLPFMLSSRGDGLLWPNNGMAELKMPAQRVALTTPAAPRRSGWADAMRIARMKKPRS